jgi:TolB-like protein/Tfp pilus assembly protein PilF
MRKPSFVSELERRNVIRATVLYAGAVWALAQGIAQLGPSVGLPDWTTRWFLVASLIGLPFWLAFAWFHDFTPDRLKRDGYFDAGDPTSRSYRRTLDAWIIGVLAIAVVLLLTDRFALHDKRSVAVALDKSIAVLPLINESADPEQDYFSDGLSEELISAIAQVHAIKVIGRNSSFQFRGRQQDDTASIGSKLGVATLLEGTVRRQGDQVRIVASLINAADGSALWSQTYARELKDVFAVQSDIATSVAGALKTALLGKTIESPDQPPGGNLDAYNALLQGRFHAERRNREDYFTATDFYRQAISLDPEYAMAYARLAIAQQWFIDWVATADERRTVSMQARANARRATELAPQSAVALGALGINQAWSDFDFRSAKTTLEKAIALEPKNAETLYQLADVTACLGRLDEAVAMMRKVLAMEPLNASFHFYIGQFLLAAVMPEKAAVEIRRAIALQPDAAGSRAYLAIALLQLGQTEQALQMANDEPDAANRRWALSTVHFATGETTQGQATLDDMIRLDVDYAPSSIAAVYVFIGSNDNAFAMLDHAVDMRDPGVASIYEQPFLIPKLRGDPRLEVLLKKLGLPEPASLNDVSSAPEGGIDGATGQSPSVTTSRSGHGVREKVVSER